MARMTSRAVTRAVTQELRLIENRLNRGIRFQIL